MKGYPSRRLCQSYFLSSGPSQRAPCTWTEGETAYHVLALTDSSRFALLSWPLYLYAPLHKHGKYMPKALKAPPRTAQTPQTFARSAPNSAFQLRQGSCSRKGLGSRCRPQSMARDNCNGSEPIRVPPGACKQRGRKGHPQVRTFCRGLTWFGVVTLEQARHPIEENPLITSRSEVPTEKPICGFAVKRVPRACCPTFIWHLPKTCRGFCKPRCSVINPSPARICTTTRRMRSLRWR